jgi:hypothetical protein
MDPDAVVDTSCRFYSAHGLADWADALPARTGGAIDLTDAARHGFSAAFAFPPFSLQMNTFERLVEQTARKPAPIPDNQQYRDPFLADDWTRTPNGKVVQRRDDLGGREWGAYLYVFSPDPLPKFWGLTGKQMREQLEAKDWRGLTVPEYLVLQRFFCERLGDHRFFEKPEDDSGSHSLWLIDSIDEGKCSVALGKNGEINIQATSIGNRDRKRAAVGGMTFLLP